MHILKNKDKRIAILLILFFTILSYRSFLLTSLFVAHDWPLLFRESRNFHPFWTISWDYMGDGGIGASAFKTLWIDLYTNFVYFVSNNLNIPWWLSQRIFWVVPFLALSLISSYKFSGLFTKKEISKYLTSLIYTFNTYILLIIGGGQFGIAFAYGLAPLTLFSLLKFFNESNSRNLIISSLFSGLLIALDARVSLLIFLIATAWCIIFIKDFAVKNLIYISLNFIMAILLNSYWILPILVTKSSDAILSQYKSIEGVKFLSFSNFSNSLSLLHPNWPENIFGKVYFFKPEFLIIPVLAFAVLVFKFKKETTFFLVLALIGVFLGKGTNEPFGQAYSFLFKNVPGFSLFRDSTKFFIIVALSYSILIPYFLENIKKFRKLPIILFVLFWLFTLKPLWSGELKGIFYPKDIPKEYVSLNDFIKSDKSFSRIIWVPTREKYGFFDPNHPALDSNSFKTLDLNNLREMGVKYIVIPYDVDGEIFMEDRKYNERKYQTTLRKTEEIEGLKMIRSFGKNVVFELDNPKDHFWSPSNLKLSYKFINPSEYRVNLVNANKGDLLVFSEGYDKYWEANTGTEKISSKPYKKLLNSFVLPRDGSYSLRIYYSPQKVVNIGLLISFLSLFSIFAFIVFGYRLGKW